MSGGHIWPEYWIDCSRCEHYEPLAVSKRPTAEAHKRGWRRPGNKSQPRPWVCPRCAATVSAKED